jgi:hypothetical protein
MNRIHFVSYNKEDTMQFKVTYINDGISVRILLIYMTSTLHDTSTINSQKRCGIPLSSTSFFIFTLIVW